MTIYECVAYLCLFFALFNKTRNSRYLLLFITAFLIAIAAFRDLNIGTDTYNYFYDFSDRGTDKEFLYKCWRDLFSICFNYDLFLLSVYSLIVGLVAKTIQTTSKNKCLSLFLFIALGYFTYSLNIMRQFMAVAIVFYAIGILYKNDNQWKKFIGLIIIASLLHTSALIALIILVCPKIKLKVFPISIMVVASFVVGFFLLEMFRNVLASISILVPSYESYLLYESTESRRLVTNLGANVLFLMTLFISSDNVKDSIYLKVYVIYIIVFNLIGGMHWLTRISEYFSIVQIVLFPLVIRNVKNPYIRMGFSAVVVCYAVGYLYVKALTESVLPYAFR